MKNGTTRFAFAAAAVAALAFAAPAQSQSLLPFAVEGRTGLAFPTGDFTLNKVLPKQGLKRMFLHSSRIVVRHPLSRERVTFEAPLPEELRSFIEITGKAKKHAPAV